MAHSVTIYTTPTCPYCQMAKQYFKSKGIEYTEVNVAADAKKAEWLVKTTGESGVPQINVDGKWIIGFDKARLEELLA